MIRVQKIEKTVSIAYFREEKPVFMRKSPEAIFVHDSCTKHIATVAIHPFSGAANIYSIT